MKRRDFLKAAGAAALAAPALAVLRSLPAVAEVAGGASADHIAVALGFAPDVLDPALARSPPIVWPTMNNVFEPLVAKTPAGDAVPGLAHWDIAEDGRIITFHLRKGVVFHSGDPLTADDILFSHERDLKNNPSYRRYLSTFDRIEKADDLTVRFYFKEPWVPFLESSFLQASSKAYHERVGEEEYVRHPVGTGPYRFVAFQPSQYLDLEAFPQYWGQQPQIKSVRFRFVTEATTRVAMLRTGEADIVMDVPTNQVALLAKMGFHNVEVPVHPSVSLGMGNMKEKAPWHDRRVRLALAEAIDGDAIVKNLFNGIPKRFPRLAPGEIGYDPTLKNYPYDPDHARALLKEAGFQDGFKARLVYTTGNYDGLKETAEAVQLYLRQIKVNVSVEGIDVPRFVELVRKSKHDPDTYYLTVVGTPQANFADPADTLTFSFYGKSPFGSYANPAVDALIEKACASLDDATRAKYVEAAFKIIHHDVPSCTLWNQVEVYAMRKGLDMTPQHRTTPMFNLWQVHRT